MKLSINMQKIFALFVAVLLMSSIMLIVMPIQPVKAQLASSQPVSGPLPAGVTVNATAKTSAYLAFRPALVGVGQTVLVNMWINPALASNNRLIPQGYVITITKPNGDKDVRTLDSEPATTAQWFEYMPDQVGTYTIKFDFIGCYFPAGRYYNGKVVTNSSGNVYGAGYYMPCSTAAQNLTVQQDFVWSWPPAQLPTDYWTRPASLNNREWWPILGNYPGTGYQGGGSVWDALYPDTNPVWSSNYGFTPWVQGPNSAHIVWKQQGAIAGLTGGPAGQYGTTSSPGSPSLVYAGRCYQTMTVPVNGVPTSCAVCYDLRTGQQYYAIPTAAPSNGVTPNLIAYVNPVANPATIAGEEIGSSTWSVELLSISGSFLYKVNPWTGALTGNYSIAPLSGGTFHNQIGGYVLNIQDLGATAGAQRYRLINWTTRGTLANLTTSTGTRIISNTTYLQSSLPSYNDWNTGFGVTCNLQYPLGIDAWYGLNFTEYNLNTGEIVHNITSDHPDTPYSPLCTVVDHGKWTTLAMGGYFIAYDLSSGKLAWRSETMDYPWGATGFGAYAIQSAYGMLFRQSYDGVYAFNWTDGKIVWRYRAPALASFESPYSTNGTEHYSFNSGASIADGKMYVYNSEHTPTWPLTRGYGLYCINITTGELIWKIDNPMNYGAIADGYLTAANSWDGYMYVFGKGKSSTAVTTPDVSVPLGTSFTIKGTVLDISPAQPNTPCVSKASMETQMEYLHLQQPIGGLWGNATITGVPVTLTAIASDGTVIDIGTTTTNGYGGSFGMAWNPPKEDTYTIMASFAGDDSYGSSMATTVLTVGPSPSVAPTATQQPQIVVPDYTMTIIAGVIALLIAIVIVGAVLYRKK